MSPLFYLILFIFGTLVGSYLNVLIFRFSPELGFQKTIRGRSRCPYCSKTLNFYELIPILSFLFQRGRCRKCRARLSIQYPLVELFSGLVFVLIPLKLGLTFPALIWLFVFLTFILIAFIDFRFGIIPDKLNLSIASLGVANFAYNYFTNNFGLTYGTIKGSFLKSYALVFWLANGNIWLNYLAGIFGSLLIFGSLYLLTRRRGIGLGDLKFAAALGILLGWPDVILALSLSFIAGAAVALFLILNRKKELKSILPFGPFMVIGVTLVFFFGYYILDGYFKLFNLA